MKYILFGLVGFYGISTIVGYLMPNSLYTHIYEIYIIWFGWVLWQSIVGYLMPNSLYTHIYEIYIIWFGWVLWHINHFRLFNAKFSI